MHWLWSEVALPVFIIFLVYWGLVSVDTEIAERQGRVHTSPFGWKYAKPSDIKDTDPRSCIWGDAALLVSGINIGLFIGGLVGLLWPSAKWLAAFIAFA